MNRKIRPFVIVGVFWFVLFLFVVASYSGEFGFKGITGFAVAEDGAPTGSGTQSLLIMVLFFTNLVTLFYLIREIIHKK